jgi:peroxiredoxin
MPIQTGQPAPAFTLFNTSKEKVSLADFKDKQNVLLLFFPLAFTSVCTKELCSVRDDIGRYSNAHAQVLGISVDSTYTLAKYAEEQALNFPLLSDFNKEVSTLYDCIYQSFGDMEMNGVSKRSSFIIDKQGIIQYAEVLELPYLLPDFEAINTTLTRLS